MRFQLIDRAKKDFPVHRLCRVLGVSQSRYFAWKDRPASRRQRDDMVMLAHVRSAFALSNGTYEAPGKQQHTAKRIFERLRDEHDYTGGYTMVKDYVRLCRARGRETFVPRSG